MKPLKTGLLMLWSFLGLINQIPAQNLLADGSFSTTVALTPYTYNYPLNQWCSWSFEPSIIQTEITEGVCKYAILAPGTASWQIQLMQWGMQFDNNSRYRLTFDVKADMDRGFGVYIGEEGGAWTAFDWSIYQQTATTKWQTKSLEFNVMQLFPMYKLSFEMGGQMGNMYFDNIVLQKIGAVPPMRIEMIGSAVPPYDWSAGVEMATTDGVHYTLNNYSIPNGEVKFRWYNDWSTNWGATDFPVGVAYSNGPNIPVKAGTYDISFNRETGEYKFYCPACPPLISIIGSAVVPYYNWTNDRYLSTTDGIIYELNNCDLTWGELRFRQDGDWAFNWGGATFPEGTGTGGAPNIQATAGYYNIVFNRLTGAYQFKLNVPVISMIGTGISDWATDVDFFSTDGTNYVLQNQTFKGGEVKFRQDHQWGINWGGNTFPWGTAYYNGPNIPVQAGTYTVSFNRVNGNYFFQLVCPALVLNCPSDISVSNDPGLCGAVVKYATPAVTDQCGNPHVFQIEGYPSGSVFPAGTTTNAYIAFNDAGGYAYCSFKVTVTDNEPPVLSNVKVSNAILWPANHRMVNVSVKYDASDNCGIVSTKLRVVSNEPESGLNEGDKSPDWMVVDNQTVQLRSERAGNGKGRTYTIIITSTDAAGNVSEKEVSVLVPHDAADYSLKAAANVALPPSAGESLQVTVTPNPSAGYFNVVINASSTERVAVSVTDAVGKVLMTTTATKNQVLRMGDELRPGIYFVRLQQGMQIKTVRLIKQ